jgi:hypothetical protein
MATPSVLAVPLTHAEQIRTKCSHVQVVKYTDLTDTAGTTKTLEIFTGRSKQGIGRVFIVIDTNFDGGATTDLTVKPILNASTGTDKDLLAAVSIHEDATEVPSSPALIATVVDGTYGAQEQAVIDLLTGRTPIMVNEAWTLDLLFTSTGANLSTLTSGKLLVFFEVIDLTGFAQIA